MSGDGEEPTSGDEEEPKAAIDAVDSDEVPTDVGIAEEIRRAVQTATSRVLDERLGPAGATGNAGKARDFVMDLLGGVVDAIQTQTGASSPTMAMKSAGDAGDASSAAADEEDSNVIDLAEARRTRQRAEPTPFELRIGDSIKSTISNFVRETGTEHDGVIEIDNTWIRQNVGKLALSLFGAVAQAVVPDTMNVSVPVPQPASAPSSEAEGDAEEASDAEATTAEPSAQSDGGPAVQMNIDLAGLFRDIFFKKDPQ